MVQTEEHKIPHNEDFLPFAIEKFTTRRKIVSANDGRNHTSSGSNRIVHIHLMVFLSAIQAPAKPFRVV